MGLKSAAELYRKIVPETRTDLDFPHEHWRSIRTNNILERLNREIRRRTMVVGCLQKHPRLEYERVNFPQKVGQFKVRITLRYDSGIVPSSFLLGTKKFTILQNDIAKK